MVTSPSSMKLVRTLLHRQFVAPEPGVKFVAPTLMISMSVRNQELRVDQRSVNTELIHSSHYNAVVVLQRNMCLFCTTFDWGLEF